MSFLSNFTYSKLMQTDSFSDMNNQQMLNAREQLMEDIDAIVDEYFQEYGITNDAALFEVLCAAVCLNFPS